VILELLRFFPGTSLENLFQYLTFRAALAAVVSFLVAIIAGPSVISWLRSRKIGERTGKTDSQKLAELHAQVGDRERLRTTLARMIATSPENLPVRLFVLDKLVDSGDLEAAKLAARAMEDAFPENADSWERLQRFYGRIRDRVRQVQAGEKYLRYRKEE